MLKLSFSKPTYCVDEKSRLVMCTYHCRVIDTETKSLFKEFDTVGKAVCHTNDTFNKNKGIMLADSRAKSSAYTIVRNTYTKCDIYQMIAKIKVYNQMVGFYHKMQYLKQQEDKHFNWLLHNDVPVDENNH